MFRLKITIDSLILGAGAFLLSRRLKVALWPSVVVTVGVSTFAAMIEAGVAFGPPRTDPACGGGKKVPTLPGRAVRD